MPDDVDDLDALFGTSDDFVENLVTEAKNENKELALRQPETTVDVDNLQQHILNKTDTMLEKAREAMEEVFMCVQAEPTNTEMIEAAGSMLKSYTGLLGQLSKLNDLNEKYKQQKELLKMKLENDQSINQNNTETALQMKREELMAVIIKHRNGIGVVDAN